MESGSNNIEQLFKQSFENFQPDVDPKVWSNIQNTIGKSGNGSGSFIGSLAGKLIIGTAAVTIVTVSAIMLVGKGDNTLVNKNNLPIKTPVTAQNLTPVITKEKSQINPNSVNVPVSNNHSGSTHQQTINPSNNTNHTTVNSVTNTVSPSVNNTPNNTDNNKQETKPIVYANPLNPGMNMPEKKSNSQNTEEQTVNSNPESEVVTANNNVKIAKIDFTTTSGSGTYAPVTVTFTNKGKAVNEEWSFGDGSSLNYEKSPVWVYEFPGEYTIILTASNEAGRIEKDSIKIKIKSNAFFIPNTFTPNGDGNNDIYKIIKNDNYPYETSKLEIVVYDRNSNKMAAFNSSDYGWDGVSIKDGRMCPQGTYLIVIKYTSSEDGKSHEERGSLFLKN